MFFKNKKFFSIAIVVALTVVSTTIITQILVNIPGFPVD